MELLVLFSRLMLAAVFMLSGLTKLHDRRGTRTLLTNFGVPADLVAPTALILPITELFVAMLLLPLSTVWWGSIGVLVLLSLFTFMIMLSLWKGNTPECHCFGQMSKSRISWKTLVRNIALISLAAVIFWNARQNPGPSLVAWKETLSTFEQIQIVLMAIGTLTFVILGWITLQLWRQQGRLLLRLDAIEALPAGTTTPGNQEAVNGLEMVDKEAPSFTLPEVSGEDVSLEDLLQEGKEMILFFLDPSCGPCTALLPVISKWQKEFADDFVAAIISRGSLADNQHKANQYQLTNLLLQSNYEVAQAFQVGVTPSAVYVHKNGRIGSPVIEGAEAIVHLVEHVIKEAKATNNSVLT